MLKDVKNGTINVIVAFKMDRLTRSVFDVEKLMTVVDNTECDIDCLNDSSNILVICTSNSLLNSL